MLEVVFALTLALSEISGEAIEVQKKETAALSSEGTSFVLLSLLGLKGFHLRRIPTHGIIGHGSGFNRHSDETLC